MSIVMFVDGVEGSVTAKGYEKWIEIRSMYQLSQRSVKSPSFGRRSNPGKGKVIFSDIEISKQIDQSSPLLLQAYFEGKCYSSIKIHLLMNDSGLLSYQEYVFSNVCFRSISRNIEHSFGKPLEVFSFNYTAVEDTFKPFDNDGKPLSPITVGYDLEQSEAM